MLLGEKANANQNDEKWYSGNPKSPSTLCFQRFSLPSSVHPYPGTLNASLVQQAGNSMMPLAPFEGLPWNPFFNRPGNKRQTCRHLYPKRTNMEKPEGQKVESLWAGESKFHERNVRTLIFARNSCYTPQTRSAQAHFPREMLTQGALYFPSFTHQKS